MSDWQKNKEARRAAYVEKLKDPRWQKLRLQVFERDGWACRRCHDTEETLNVHHLYYENGKEPWEYPLSAFLTFCEECHGEETELRPAEEQLLLHVLRRERFLSSHVNELALALHELEKQNLTDDDLSMVMGAFWKLLSKPAELQALLLRFFPSYVMGGAEAAPTEE